MASGTRSRGRKTAAAPARKGPSKGRKPRKASPRSTPATDVEVDAEVLEFIEAIDRYRKERSRPFPSWSEVLHVLRSLGYRKGA